MCEPIWEIPEEKPIRIQKHSKEGNFSYWYSGKRQPVPYLHIGFNIFFFIILNIHSTEYKVILQHQDISFESLKREVKCMCVCCRAWRNDEKLFSQRPSNFLEFRLCIRKCLQVFLFCYFQTSCYISQKSQVGSYLQESARFAQFMQAGWHFPNIFISSLKRGEKKGGREKKKKKQANSATFESLVKTLQHISHLNYSFNAVRFLPVGVLFSFLALFFIHDGTSTTQIPH